MVQHSFSLSRAVGANRSNKSARLRFNRQSNTMSHRLSVTLHGRHNREQFVKPSLCEDCRSNSRLFSKRILLSRQLSALSSERLLA